MNNAALVQSGKQGFVPIANLRPDGGERVLLDYGEALTTNTAQGSTVSEHIHALPAGSALVSAFGAWNWYLPAWVARLLRIPQNPPVPLENPTRISI